MPIYEYQCSACGHQLEALQKFSDEPMTECPECHQSALSKLISSTSFQLKGTGWYVTDIRDKGKPKPSESGSSTSGSVSSTSTETKTAATTTDSKPKDSNSGSSNSNDSTAA